MAQRRDISRKAHHLGSAPIFESLRKSVGSFVLHRRARNELQDEAIKEVEPLIYGP